eukprot:Colp12_sorted_trinity150504_noHs@23840
MPMILLCGLPSSGKTRRAQQLADYYRNEGRTVDIINEEGLQLQRSQAYSSSHEEKMTRGAIKAGVERKLSKESIVIVDSMNYIKGFRYELYCLSRAGKTPHCVLWCDINPEKAKELNSQREGDRYSEEMLNELVQRFEQPQQHQRWDSPLFIVQLEDELPYTAISQAIFERKPPPPNAATETQPLSATNFLYELDQVTQEILTQILEGQKMSVPGEDIAIAKSNEPFRYTRTVGIAELRRLRREFINFTKTHSAVHTIGQSNSRSVGTLFVQYLNNAAS